PWRHRVPETLPVVRELASMLRGPFEGHSERARGQSAGEHGKCLDSDRGVVVAVPCVEARPAVLGVEHADDDPEETTDLWHLASTREDGVGRRDPATTRSSMGGW